MFALFYFIITVDQLLDYTFVHIGWEKFCLRLLSQSHGVTDHKLCCFGINFLKFWSKRNSVQPVIPKNLWNVLSHFLKQTAHNYFSVCKKSDYIIITFLNNLNEHGYEG